MILYVILEGIFRIENQKMLASKPNLQLLGFISELARKYETQELRHGVISDISWRVTNLFKVTS